MQKLVGETKRVTALVNIKEYKKLTDKLDISFAEWVRQKIKENCK